MDEDLKKLEQDLGKLSPLGMPDDLLARLDEAMCRWHETVPEQEKVITFKPATSATGTQVIVPTTQSKATRSARLFPRLASAAAVAALGVLSANFYLKNESGAPSTANSDFQSANISQASISERDPLTQTSQTNFLPVSATTDVVNAADRGIIYMPNGQAARCLAIHYQDHIEYRNEKGELLKLNKPDLKIIYLPLKTD